jgi:hypothetical protein
VTFLAWSTRDGTRGRCDERCHMAERPGCACLCNGVYHGAGRREGELLRRVQALHERQVLPAARARAAAEGLKLYFEPTAQVLLQRIPGQRDLFGGGRS